VGTINTRESPLNVVKRNKPNVLTGLHQKVSCREWFVVIGPSWTFKPPAKRRDPPRSEIYAEQGKPVVPPETAGEPQGTLLVLRAKD